MQLHSKFRKKTATSTSKRVLVAAGSSPPPPVRISARDIQPAPPSSSFDSTLCKYTANFEKNGHEHIKMCARRRWLILHHPHFDSSPGHPWMTLSSLLSPLHQSHSITPSHNTERTSRYRVCKMSPARAI